MKQVGSVQLTQAQENAVRVVLGFLADIRRGSSEVSHPAADALVALQSKAGTDVGAWAGFQYQRERGVISILGTRGVGKTTVLREVVRRLVTEHEPETLVLDPIIPEAFLVADHPAGWIAAGLRAHVDALTEQFSAAPDSRVAQELRHAFDDFSERVYLYIAGGSTTSRHNGGSIEQRLDETVAASIAGREIPRAFGAFLHALFEARRAVFNSGRTSASPEQPLLVIPFDDVDLHPRRARSVLDAIPSLLAQPGVAVIVAFDPTTLRADFRSEAAAFLGGDAGPQALEFAEDQLRKRLPRDLRVSVPSLSRPERLSFVPDGASASLLEVLRSVRIGEETIGPQSLGDLFHLGWNYAAGTDVPADEQLTLYCDILPDDPRALGQLHRVLHRQVEPLGRIWATRGSPSFAQSYERATTAVLHELVESARQKYAASTSRLDEFLVWDSNAQRFDINPQKEWNWVVASRPQTLTETYSADLWYAYRVAVEGRVLATPANALAHFVSEFMGHLPVAAQTIGGRIATPGGTAQPVVRRVANDRLGWWSPNFDHFSTHFARSARWNRTIQLVLGEFAGRRRFIGAEAGVWHLRLLYWYLHSVVCAPVVGAPGVRRSLSDQELSSDELWLELGAQATRLMAGLRRMVSHERSVLAYSLLGDYSSWTARDLAFMTFPDVCPDAEVRRRVGAFREAVAQELSMDGASLAAGLSDAEGYLTQAMGALPVVSISSLSMDELLQGLVTGNQEAIRRATYALQTDRTPSKKRSTLEAVMRQLGLPVPGLVQSQPLVVRDERPVKLT